MSVGGNRWPSTRAFGSGASRTLRPAGSGSLLIAPNVQLVTLAGRDVAGNGCADAAAAANAARPEITSVQALIATSSRRLRLCTPR
jgi:hypothetical protein